MVIDMKISCIFCKSDQKIVKAGFRNNESGKKQRFICRRCNHTFVPNDGFWKMKHKPEVIAEAISCRKRGMPYQEVSKHFKEYNKADICPATAYNWVQKYGKVLKNFNLKQIPQLSGKINLDEFVFKFKKRSSIDG